MILPPDPAPLRPLDQLLLTTAEKALDICIVAMKRDFGASNELLARAMVECAHRLLTERAICVAPARVGSTIVVLPRTPCAPAREG